AKAVKDQVQKVYDHLEPFPIENDRMAELLLPLQAVLQVVGGGDRLELLESYAHSLDERDQQAEMQTPGGRLLVSCKDIYANNAKAFLKTQKWEPGFIPTTALIQKLVNRTEEPWASWNRGRQITSEALAYLLRPYGIKSKRDRAKKNRGFYACDFKEAW